MHMSANGDASLFFLLNFMPCTHTNTYTSAEGLGVGKANVKHFFFLLFFASFYSLETLRSLLQIISERNFLFIFTSAYILLT